MRLRWPIALLLVAASILVAFLFSGGRPASSSLPRPTPAPGTSADSVADASVSVATASPVSGDRDDDSALSRRLAALVSALRGGASPAEALSLLAQIKRLVHALPPEQAAAELIAFLETGEDMSTGLSFEIGPEGVMKQIPTVRTAAIDLLGQSDASQSVDYSRKILRSTASADEYALALRNLGWSFPVAVTREELADGFRGMLARPDWRSQPSRGFLEAFDVAVVAGSARDVAPLLQNGEPETAEPPLSRAAFVALDRMMLRDPAAMVRIFAEDPQFLANAPFHRASIMTRLDPRDPGQKELLASYILRGDHAPGELDYFAEIFPNPNRFSSHRLVSGPEKGGSSAEQTAMDDAVLRTIDAWMPEPRFSPARETLGEIRRRLSGN